ncbi:MAG: reverse transcriptase domain-containing protein, partial [Actinomycetota bacterium]|nr:reverse transcriptase domain-containing protein [Actinomycetota bacterium]
PEPVRSVRTLREHIDGTAEGRSGESLADSLNQGESEYMEEQAKIEEEAAMKEMQEVKRALDEAEKKKPSFEKIKTKLQSLIKKIREKTTLLDGEQEQQLGKELENWKQPFTSSKPPESAKLADDSDTESEPNDINEPIDEAADAVSGKSKGEAMANGDQPAKPIKVYQMKPGMQVAIDTERFGAEYAKGKPKELTGTIVKKGKGGVMYVRYDIDDKVARSHWKHLRPVGAGEKTTLTSLIMTLSTLAVLAAQGMRSTKDNWPKSFFECLIRPDWRDWVEAVRKEMVGWDSNRVYERVRVRDTDPSKPIIPLGELYTIKRCGRHKYRQIALGNYLRAGFDYAATFATTVSADALRFFFALAVAADKVIRGLDVTTAYLQSEQRSVV